MKKKCVNTFEKNVRKPPVVVIFFLHFAQPKDPNLLNYLKSQISSQEHHKKVKPQAKTKIRKLFDITSTKLNFYNCSPSRANIPPPSNQFSRTS